MGKYYNPVKIFFGSEQVKNLGDIFLREINSQRILLLTGKSSLKKSGYLDMIANQLSNFELQIYSGVPSNPDVADIYSIKKDTDSFNYDCIITAGGGSVIDMGKALAAFKGKNVGSPADVRDIITEKSYIGNPCSVKLLAIPTTAGTGSEVTPWATIWDKEQNKKFSIEGSGLFPDIAIVDPLLTVNQSVKLTVSSGLDAVSHAVEAFWSKRSNEIVRLYAARAVDNIISNLSNLIDNPNDLDLRSSISQGSLFAGLAFSNTKTTACHSISYPMTLRYGIDHGVAVILTLAEMLTVNEEALAEKDKLFTALRIETAADAGSVINSIMDKAGISIRLRDYGIKEDELSLIADESFTPGRMDNNPVTITKESLLDILKKIY